MNEQKTNRLANETSPYLLQHAHNPVDWYPWDPEALELARQRDCPIFLSIGYSACHWCHVMEHESFEDPETAELMNREFVNIKVDREERPDLDQIYMTAVQAMTRHGGWPMSVWLTPSLKPFYGGTYFPPEPRFNMPSFRDILSRIAEVWRTRRQEAEQSAESLTTFLQQQGTLQPSQSTPSVELIDHAAAAIERAFDRIWGGIGAAPKFPHSVELRVALRGAKRADKEPLRHVALYSLERMIRGGIYDQLGGGFHRYSTDERWLAPHFEKMLYDNALISLACLEAYQATGAELYRRAVCDTLDYVLREMTSPDGAFYSTQDADSEGEEGKFFVWSHQEVEQLLGQDAEVFCHCYDVKPGGNWEGKTILNLPETLEECSKALAIDEEELQARLAACRERLFEARSQRVRPGRDDKILTSWNAMMIDAFAVASRVLDNPTYQSAAEQAARFLLTHLRSEDGRLYRTGKDGRFKLNAYLEDYAYLLNALVSVYEATFDAGWIRSAVELYETMVEQFWDEESGGFFYTGKDHEQLIARGKDPHDGAVPSGNSMAVNALARLAKLTGRSDVVETVEKTLCLFHDTMSHSPTACSQMLIGLGIHLGPTVEFALVGDPDDETTKAYLRAIYSRFLPNKVVALKPPTASADVVRPVELLAQKELVDGRPTAYICENFACREPITDLATLQATLQKM